MTDAESYTQTALDDAQNTVASLVRAQRQVAGLAAERGRYRETLAKIRDYEAEQDLARWSDGILEDGTHCLVWSWTNEALEVEG